jgi:acetyltransferase
MKANILHPPRSRKNDVLNFAYEPPHFAMEHTVDIKPYGRLKLRPIRITDENRMIEFHETLSEESIYLRYFAHITLDTRTIHERLVKVCANTADSFAIVAERHGTGNEVTEILGVGRLSTYDETDTAAFAVLVADEAQDTTLPRELLKRLIAIARAFRFKTLTGELLVADSDGLSVCRDLGFTLHTIPEDGIVFVSIPL